MKASVFIIDDVEMMRALIRRLLADGPSEVVGEAATFQSALQKLADVRPDLIILSIEVADANGVDAIAKLRASHPDVALLVASTHNDAGSVYSALQMGAHGYLIKPFAPGVLEDAITRALHRSGNSQRALSGG